MSVFHFDEAAHEYFLGEKRLPGVTEVLRAHGLIDDRYFTEEGRRRGRYVHRATHFLDEQDLDWSSVKPEYAGYVRGWERLVRETRLNVLRIEEPTVSEAYGFAGTPDRGVRLNGRLALIDIKTGQVQDWNALQTGAYAILWPEYRYAPRFVAELHADGSYRLVPFEDPSDPVRFLACLDVYRWKQQHGYLLN